MRRGGVFDSRRPVSAGAVTYLAFAKVAKTYFFRHEALPARPSRSQALGIRPSSRLPSGRPSEDPGFQELGS